MGISMCLLAAWIEPKDFCDPPGPLLQHHWRQPQPTLSPSLALDDSADFWNRGMLRVVRVDCASLCHLACKWSVSCCHFFLPFGTAFAETGMVIFTRLMYNRFVHSNKSDPEGPLVGDQLYIPAPCLIMSAHAFAEGCRLTATLSGVIQSGGWNWIPPPC